MQIEALQVCSEKGYAKMALPNLMASVEDVGGKDEPREQQATYNAASDAKMVPKVCGACL